MKKRNDATRLLKFSNKSGSHRNCLRINLHNSKEHEYTKIAKAIELMKQGCEIMTEAKFETGGQADIICLDTKTIYEILYSESLEKVREKIKSYPKELTIVAVDSQTGKETLIR